MDTELAERLDRIERLTLLSAKEMLSLEDVSLLTGYSMDYLRKKLAKDKVPYSKAENSDKARVFYKRYYITQWLTKYQFNY